MDKRLTEEIFTKLLEDYPREGCGLVIDVEGKLEYFPCRNLAASDADFKLSNKDWVAASDRGEVMYIVHSHPDESANPSDSDLKACEAEGIPWLIFSIVNRRLADVKEVRPTGWKAPLVGREFHHGTLDCYTLIQDWYAREKGITLPDFPREDCWWSKGENLYLSHFEEAGFFKLPQESAPEVGDVILMQLRSNVPNHGAIYLGDTKLTEAPHLHKVYDAILHHLYGRLSTREVYGGYWRQITTHILRYKDELPA